MELSTHPTEEEFKYWAKQPGLKQPEGDQDFDLTIEHIGVEVFVDIINDPEVTAAGNKDYFLMWIYARVYNRLFKLSSSDRLNALGDFTLALQKCEQIRDIELTTWANRLKTIFESMEPFPKDEWSRYFREYFEKSSDKI